MKTGERRRKGTEEWWEMEGKLKEKKLECTTKPNI